MRIHELGSAFVLDETSLLYRTLSSDQAQDASVIAGAFFAHVASSIR